MSRRFFVPSAIVALASVAAPAFAQVDLRPNRTQGDEAAFELTTRSTQTSVSTRIPGGSATQEHEQTVHLRLKVLETAETGATMALTFERIRYDLNPGMGQAPMSFDSEKPPGADGASPLAQGLRPVLNKTYIVTVDPTGTVTDVTIPAALSGLAGENSPAGTFVDPELLKASIGSIVALPGTPGEIKIGDTWSTTASEPLFLGNSAVIGSTMTLESAGDTEAIVGVVGTMRVEGPHGMEPISVAVKESATTGEIVWSLSDGFIIRSTTDETAEIEGEPQPDFKIKVRTVSHSEIKRLK